MENAIIIVRMIATMVNYTLLTVFGLLAFAELCLAAYCCLQFLAGGTTLWLGVGAIYTTVGMWGLICLWFLYSSGFRNDRASGAWFPAFWLAAALTTYAGWWSISAS